MTKHKYIENINLRATALKEFWGTEYDNSIYLWEGAKHNLTLSEIDQIKTPTFKNIFSLNEEKNNALETCKKLYFKFSQLLTEKLNEIHDINLPVNFWRTVFAYWLYRHICIVYEKYSYLSKFDIDKTSIKLLDKDSFFIPHDHYEFVHCFCNDFGVQQLVSQYYYLFRSKEFPIINKVFTLPVDNKTIENENLNIRRFLSVTKRLLFRAFKKNLSVLIKPKIVLLNVYYSHNVFKQLVIKSKGQIQLIGLPRVKTLQNQSSKSKRQKLLNIDSNNDFEYFLVQTFYYCFPKILVEKFRDYYDVFLRDIQKKRFTHIVSEAWISDLPTSIYVAIAQHKGRRLICQEHAAGDDVVKNSLIWIRNLVAYKYLTTGWKSKKPNIIPGGFSCRDIASYSSKQWGKDILFICHTHFPYLMDFSAYPPSNSSYVKELKVVSEFITLLPDGLRDNFVLRPRRDKNYWDNEYAWEVKKNEIKIDTGVFSESILKSRIVVTDHITTALAEILLMKVPFFLILNPYVEIKVKYKRIFDKLIECKVVHTSPYTAVEHLNKIYNEVQGWWNGDTVRRAVNNLISEYLAPSSKTVDYLLSCLEEDLT